MLNTLPTFLKSTSLGNPLGAADATGVANASRPPSTSGNGDFAALMQRQTDQRLAEQRQTERRSTAAAAAPTEGGSARPNAKAPPRATQPAAKQAETPRKEAAPTPQASAAPPSEQAQSVTPAQPEPGHTNPTGEATDTDVASVTTHTTPATLVRPGEPGLTTASDGPAVPSALTAIQAALLAAAPSATGLHPWSSRTNGGDEPAPGLAPVTLPGATQGTALPTTATKGKKRDVPASVTPDDGNAASLTASGTPGTDPNTVQPWLLAQALVTNLPAAEAATGPVGVDAEAANDALPSTADLALSGQRQRAAQAGASGPGQRASRLRNDAANGQDAGTDPSKAAHAAPTLASPRTPLGDAMAPESAQADSLAQPEALTPAQGAAVATAVAQAALQAGAAQATPAQPGTPAQASVDAVAARAGDVARPAAGALASTRAAKADASPTAAGSPASPAVPSTSTAGTSTSTSTSANAAAADEATRTSLADTLTQAAHGPATSAIDTTERSATATGTGQADPTAAGAQARGESGSQGSAQPEHGARPDAARDTTALPLAQGLTAPSPQAGHTAANEAPSRAMEALGATTSAAAPTVGNTNLPQATGNVATPANPGQGAAAMAEVRIPVPLDSPAFAPALGAQVSLLAKDGVQTARLQLNPAEMGPITVQIAVEGNGARVDFAAERAGTREAIEASLPALAGALQDAGLTLTGGGVFQQSPGHHQQQQQPQPGQTAFNPTPGATLRGQDTSTTLAANAGMPTPRRGLVDLVA